MIFVGGDSCASFGGRRWCSPESLGVSSGWVGECKKQESNERAREIFTASCILSLSVPMTSCGQIQKCQPKLVGTELAIVTFSVLRLPFCLSICVMARVLELCAANGPPGRTQGLLNGARSMCRPEGSPERSGRIRKGQLKRVRGWSAQSGGPRRIVSEGSSQKGPLSM